MRLKLANRSSLEEALARVGERPEVYAALLVSSDGLPVAVYDRDGSVRDPEAWAAVGAALAGLTEQLAQALQRGGLEWAVFRAERRWLVVRLVSLGFLILVTAGEPGPSLVNAAVEEVERAARELRSSDGSER